MRENVLLVFHSKSGNTELLARWIQDEFTKKQVSVSCVSLPQVEHVDIMEYDVICLGTYTWGNGNIPSEWERVWDDVTSNSAAVYGVFGTGDSFYPNFCGAVTSMCHLLLHSVKLVCSLKVELRPQASERIRCERFVQKLLQA